MNTRDPKAVRTPTSPGTFSTAARIGKLRIAEGEDVADLRVEGEEQRRIDHDAAALRRAAPIRPGGSVFISP